MTSALVRALGARVMHWKPGFASVSHFNAHAHPVHSMGSPSLPRPPFGQTMYSGAGISGLLAIAYDYNVLGLGPD